MDIEVKLSVNLKPLEQYIELLTKPGKPGHNEILLRWLIRYKKFAKAQFNKNSRGGGIWPPLKKKTKKRVKKRSRRILWDSETLSHTVDPIPTLDKNPAPGILTIRTTKGLTIAFGGGGRHPYSKLSIARLATVHSLGLGNNPVRVILVPPTEEIKRRMVDDVRNVARETKRLLGLK